MKNYTEFTYEEMVKRRDELNVKFNPLGQHIEYPEPKEPQDWSQLDKVIDYVSNLRVGPAQLENMPHSVKENPEVARAAMSRDFPPNAEQFMALHPDDRELHLAAAKNASYDFKKFPEAMRNDREIAFEAIYRQPSNINYLGKELGEEFMSQKKRVLYFLGDPLGRTEHAERDELQYLKDKVSQAESYAAGVVAKFDTEFGERDPGKRYEKFVQDRGLGRPDDHKTILSGYTEAASTYDRNFKRKVHMTKSDNVYRIDRQSMFNIKAELKPLPEYIEYRPELSKLMQTHGMTRQSIGNLNHYPEQFRKDIETTLRYLELKAELKPKENEREVTRSRKI